jgi:membrane protein implicated in regulation of membrane protease activity
VSEFVVWFVLAAGLIVAELFTGTFYLLMVSIGFAVGGLAALAGADLALQLVVGAAVGIAATVILRRTHWGKMQPTGDALRNRDVFLDIGQVVYVDEWKNRRTRVDYRGSRWDAMLEPGAEPVSGNMEIQAVYGSTLVLAPARSRPRESQSEA